MMVLALVLLTAGFVLLYAGVKGTDPRDEVRKAFV
jgi:hypothetical protein